MVCVTCNDPCDDCKSLGVGSGACEPLHDFNNQELKPLVETLKYTDICDLPYVLEAYVKRETCLNDNIINNICALWEKVDNIIDNMVSEEGYLAVTKIFSYTVPADRFVRIRDEEPVWFSGSVEKDESFITIPVTDMDLVDTVVAQPQVMVPHVGMQTVAIQSAVREGDNYIVNFDGYEWNSNAEEAPYDLNIHFVVIGRKLVHI